MKRATGKSNIDIVKGYLAGERPFTQVGYTGDADKYIIRKEGEEWTDSNGKKWKQTASGKTRVTPVLDMVREALNEKCSSCGCELRWGRKIDRKMFYRTKKCFDCVIEEETQLRLKGQFKLYETKKLVENELSYLYDIKQKLRESRDYLKEHKTITYVNSTGHVEEWSNEARLELMHNIRKDWIKCLKGIRAAEAELRLIESEISKVIG